MIKGGLNQFKGQRVVLLQGPIGPFFRRLADDLEAAGALVFKINFNGGDWIFFRKNATHFNAPLSTWPAFFEAFIKKNNIQTVLLFGDCRPIHQAAHQVASEHQLEIGVFEEGYIRPHYITLERYGVNANSTLSKSPDFYAALPQAKKLNTVDIAPPFWFAAMWGMMYNAASVVLRPFFRHYQHHRILSIWQGLYWIRSLWRKWLFEIQQKNMLHTLITQHHKKYYLVPLQVHNDAQIHHHSDFFSIEAFISQAINSFVLHAPEDNILVIKHHPMDRGFNHYGKLIRLICQKSPALKHRIYYVHDLHLPTLLEHAKGVVVINSTVGLSALDHLCPVITCGEAIYDIAGLTYQGNLDNFWQAASSFAPDKNLHYKFVHELAQNSQINGNFYRRFKNTSYKSGVYWPNGDSTD